MFQCWSEKISQNDQINDCAGQVETPTVEDTLTEAGYEVVVLEWGRHNTIITSIKKDGIEKIPSGITFGYDNPREYLPAEIIELLDKVLPSDSPYTF